MQFRLCTLGLSLLLCLPVLAETPKPAPTPPAAAPPAAFHWPKLTRNHIAPAAALVALHWDLPTATLPAGVERVYALQSNQTLLLHATDAGFAEATRLVQTIDLPPAAKPAAVPQVRLQVDFVGVSTADMDNLGVTFEPVPAVPVRGQPVPPVTRLRTATGNLVSQLYQTLTRMHGSVAPTPTALTDDKATAKFAVDTQVSYCRATINGSPPAKTKVMRLQTSLSVRPRINADGSVTVQLVTQAGDSITRTTSNGQVMVLAGLPLSKDKLTDDQELLVFVTPTVLGSVVAETEARPAATPSVDTGQPDPPMPGITDTPAEAKRFATVDVYNADMATVAAMLQRQMGVLISLRVGDKPFRDVSVHLEHATASQILRAVARSAGATVTREQGGGFVFAIPTDATATSQAVPATYHWHTIVLAHTTPAEMLARLFQADSSQTTTLTWHVRGVRMVGAVPGNSALRVEATDDGLAQIKTLVSILDPAGRQIRLETLLLGVPAGRTDFSVQDPPAALLAALRQGTYRVIQTPAVTALEDRDTTGIFYYTPPPPAPTTTPPKQLILIASLAPRLKFTPLPGDNFWSGHLGTPSTFQLTPHFGDEDVIALNLQFGSHTVTATQPVRLGKLAVAELPRTPAAPDERLFFFVRPTLLPSATDSGAAVIVTP